MGMPNTRDAHITVTARKGRGEGPSVWVYTGKCSLVIKRCRINVRSYFIGDLVYRLCNLVSVKIWDIQFIHRRKKRASRHDPLGGGGVWDMLSEKIVKFWWFERLLLVFVRTNSLLRTFGKSTVIFLWLVFCNNSVTIKIADTITNPLLALRGFAYKYLQILFLINFLRLGFFSYRF